MADEILSAIARDMLEELGKLNAQIATFGYVESLCAQREPIVLAALKRAQDEAYELAASRFAGSTLWTCTGDRLAEIIRALKHG